MSIERIKTRLDELAALEKAATLGPWRHDERQGVGTVVAAEDWMVCDCGTRREAELVVASRNALPSLIAALRLAVEQVESEQTISKIARLLERKE